MPGLAELSFDCVMCGLCTSRCPAEICQYNIAILGRRLYAKYVAPKAEHLAAMVKEVESGKYEPMLKELMDTDEETLKKIYTAREIEPEQAGEDWIPKDKTIFEIIRALGARGIGVTNSPNHLNPLIHLRNFWRSYAVHTELKALIKRVEATRSARVEKKKRGEEFPLLSLKERQERLRNYHPDYRAGRGGRSGWVPARAMRSQPEMVDLWKRKPSQSGYDRFE